MDYSVRVGIELGHEASDNFDIQDVNYFRGDTQKRPPDFDLHLALYLLQKEHLPCEMLERLRQWANENKMAGFHYERVMRPAE